MNILRILTVANREIRTNFTRPVFIILIIILAFMSFGFSSGDVRISSGDASVGGTKSLITSEHAISMILSLIIFIFYMFFIAVTAGMTIIQDDEWKIRELLHTTRLKPIEYLLGKFSAIMASFGIILALHVIMMIFFYHVIPNADAMDYRGPFSIINYLRPAIYFGLPFIFFMAALTFTIGEWSRKPIVVYFVPIILLTLNLFFLLNWSPAWLSLKWNQFLMIMDPSGFRWLDETWLKMDRGVEYYNTAAVAFDGVFLLNRLLFISLGSILLFICYRHFSSRLRRTSGKRVKKGTPVQTIQSQTSEQTPVSSGLSVLGMTNSRPSHIRAFWEVLRIELRELRGQAGLYLFVPLIMLQVFSDAMMAYGAFDMPLIITSGLFAARSMDTLTLTTCLLLLFYIVESIRREKNVKLDGIYHATPISNSVILFGKVMANSLVGVLIMLAIFLTGMIFIMFQGQAPFEIKPFMLLWVVLLVPTFMVWTAFVMSVYTVVKGRYTTYAIALVVLIFTGYRQTVGKMNWVGNWDLWNVVAWSDISVLELDRPALVWNRLFALSLTVLFTAVAMHFYSRRQTDTVQMIHRFNTGLTWRQFTTVLILMIIPTFFGIGLLLKVRAGFQGSIAEKYEKDYWRKNISTYRDAEIPGLKHVDLDLNIDPASSHLVVNGTFEMINENDHVIKQFPITGHYVWEELAWTLNGQGYEPENRESLYIFKPDPPLEPGDSISVGFSYHADYPQGITKNGGGTSEFILPSGVVLTSFSPSIAPVMGFMEGIGIDEENQYDAREYPDDFYLGMTKPFIGSQSPFTTHISITVPSDFRANSVGTLMETRQDNDRTTYVWDSDYPVRFFNVVAGRWVTSEGEGTCLYYHPGHPQNIEEITLGLNSALKHYSDWFAPFPWNELRISEFPGLAYYAQGFPTNISFSENIGFLTDDDETNSAAFVVTAHESAHQWWANLLTPGEGPGGNILSEGMAHFSTLMLLEEVKGDDSRKEFCRRIETMYSRERQKDSERPMVQVDGSRPGDSTVMYNKGGWVFWMMMNQMGRTHFLEGIREFIDVYRHGPDYPVLQDFIEIMRPFASDPESFDQFVNQWFFEVIIPRYTIEDIQVSEGENAVQEVSFNLNNTGTGTMRIEVIVTDGDIEPEDDSDVPVTYQSESTTVSPAPGESIPITLICKFEPDQIIIDPEIKVLQLQRKHATVKIP